MRMFWNEGTAGIHHRPAKDCKCGRRSRSPLLWEWKQVRLIMSKFIGDSRKKRLNSVSETALNRPPAFKEGETRPSAAYAIFACMAALYLLPFMRVLLPWTNEGTLASGAVRIVHGQVFARDFFEVMGPGTFYLLAGFFKVLGVSFIALRADLFVTSLGTALLVYFLSRRVCSEYRTLPCLVLAGTYYGLQWPGISHHVDSNFFSLLAVATVVLWQQKRWASLLISAGVLAGLTVCFHQTKGLALFLSILLWLRVRHREEFAALSSRFVLGFAGVGAPVLVWFWSQSALGSLFYANLVWPFRHYEAVNVIPYGLGIFSQYWHQWVHGDGRMNWSVWMGAILIVPFLFIAALPLIVTVLGVRYRGKTAPPEVLLYAICGSALWTSEMHRKDIYHLVFGAPLLLILCVHFLLQSRKRIADYALQILAITSGCLMVFNLLLVSTAHAIPTRVGSVAMYEDSPVVAFLDAHTVSGEETFVYPYCPIYYFLTATMNPTRFITLTYNYNTAEEFQDTIRILDEHKVRYVVWDSNFLTRTASRVFSNAARTPAEGFVMEKYLEAHYATVLDDHGLRVLERNPEHAAGK